MATACLTNILNVNLVSTQHHYYHKQMISEEYWILGELKKKGLSLQGDTLKKYCNFVLLFLFGHDPHCALNLKVLDLEYGRSRWQMRIQTVN